MSQNVQAVTLHRWNHPSNIWIAGPTQSGKTDFASKMIRYRKHLFRPPIHDVVFVYSVWQPKYDQLRDEHVDDIVWVNGLPQDPFKYFKKTPGLLILDDSMVESEQRASDVIKWFTKGSHHRNVSIAILVQNLFPKQLRDLSLNAHLLVLFNNPRDKSQVKRFIAQAFPEEGQRIKNAMAYAFERPYRPLIVNTHQQTPSAYSLTCDVFPEDLKQSKEPFPQVLLP